MVKASVQTELKIARSYLTDAEAKLHAAADVMFELARRVYGEAVPYARTFGYGDFFGAPPLGERKAPPLDIGTKHEYRQWLEEASRSIWADLTAAGQRLKAIVKKYPGAALIEEGVPKYAAAALYAYAWLLLGDYHFYRCEWSNAAKAYRNALKLAPMDQGIVYRLGLSYVNDGDASRAHNFLERAIELEPSSDVAVEAHKQLDRLAAAAGEGKLFRGSPAVLKTMLGITIGGFVLCLSCICCGLLGAWAEISEEGDAEFALWWGIGWGVAGGLIFIAPAVATAIYYLVKKR